jgi:hypothetical protein
MLDAVMLVARLPRSACVMKASLMRNPFLGAGARLARYIRNDSTYGMVRLAVADLRRRRAAGAVSRRHAHHAAAGQPLPLGRGPDRQARQAPVQTVFIDTDSPYLGKGWPLWRLPPAAHRLHGAAGPALHAGDDPAFQAELEAYYAAGVRPARGLPMTRACPPRTWC